MKLLTIVSTVLGFLPVCVPVLNRRPRAKNRTTIIVFFCRRRQKSEPSYTRRLPPRRSAPGSPYRPRAIFRWLPPPCPGGARPEGNRRPGGNDRAEGFIRNVPFCYTGLKFYYLRISRKIIILAV